ncbi:Helicase PriA essential for oriC/DnaA-independent DNA replication [hydrothermal vent metagenome]|uniref:DNA 3'-5' helicase n=1 Tax=hydrothermal vent metagenome TaxID=652676 RepID=A0A3B0VQW3_9ZZZZ
MTIYADLAVPLPLDGFFTYEVPRELRPVIKVGQRVLIPFSGRVITGYVVALKKEAGLGNAADGKEVKIKAIADILDTTPLFDSKRLKFLRWVSSYYMAAPGEVFPLTHPPLLNLKSCRYLSLTEQGATALAKGEGGRGRALLNAIGGGAPLPTLQKKVRQPGLYALVGRLKRDGLIREEVKIKGGGRGKTERYARLAVGIGLGTLPGKVGNAPLQLKVAEYLAGSGKTSFKVLRENFGSVDSAVKGLTGKGLVLVGNDAVERDPFKGLVPRPSDFEPTEEQAFAIERISSTLGQGFAPYLLYGITGSGKTLVYLKIIEEVVKSGRRALVLVPEIALTGTLFSYLTALFPDRVAVVHSSLSEGERYDQWQKIRAGRADIVIGARSALFAPLVDTGVIIVDEEHDPSYKQSESPRYNARDAALMLGKILGATVVLGSATPSLESFSNAQDGRITLLRLSGRVGAAALPEIELLDMRGAAGDKSIISERLEALMEETLGRGEQVILFLNRRGFSNFFICRDCGEVVRCTNCEVSLTRHKGDNLLRCHYCDLTMATPKACPLCKSGELASPGLGTEKVEEEVVRLFPEACVARLDRDSTRRKGSVMRILAEVEAGRVDVLIGTQMVSKGHHFPDVTLVGVISADTSLNMPDFRSAERTFQLISQASGRAGRGEKPARVVVQTLSPFSECLKSAADHDYEGFFEAELALRDELGYPPGKRLASVRIEGAKESSVLRFAKTLERAAEASRGRVGGDVVVLGPAPMLIARLKGKHRLQMLVKAGDAATMNRFLRSLLVCAGKVPSSLALTVDVDPIMTV